MPDSASVLFAVKPPLWSCVRCAGFGGVTSRANPTTVCEPRHHHRQPNRAFLRRLASLRSDETVSGGLPFASLVVLAHVTNDSILSTPRVVPLAANAAALPRLPCLFPTTLFRLGARRRPFAISQLDPYLISSCGLLPSSRRRMHRSSPGSFSPWTQYYFASQKNPC
jgi:hypothetical protein